MVVGKEGDEQLCFYQTLRILGKHISALLAFGKLTLPFNFLIKRNYVLHDQSPASCHFSRRGHSSRLGCQLLWGRG